MGVILLAAVGAVAGTVGWAVRDQAAQRAAFEQQIAREQAARQAKLAEDVELALQEAQTLGERALALVDDNPYQWEATLAAALAACSRADAQAKPNRAALDPALLGRLSALNDRLQADEQDRQFVAQIDAIRVEAGQVDLERSQFKEAEQSLKVKALFQTRGIEFGATSPQQVVAWIQSRPQPIRKHVIAAFDVWLAWLSRATAEPADERRWLIAVLRAADADAWRTQARSALLARDAQALENLVREVQPAQQPATFLLLLARQLPQESGATRLNILRQIQSAYPGDFWANEDYGLALISANPPQWDAAVRFYTAAVALRPENPGAHLNLGRALGKAGDLHGALAAYRKALELAPNYAMAYNNLGIDLSAQGDVPGAIAAYSEAIRLDPKYASPHYNLGNALQAKGDLDDAIGAYRQAISLNHKNARPHNGLGIALRAKGDLDGAVTAYRDAIGLDPNFALPHNGLGNALQDNGDLDGAIAAYRKAISLNPKLAFPHYGLGNALRAKGDLDGAIAAYREAIRLDPKYAKSHNNLGNALRAKGDLDGAVAAFSAAIELDPKYALAWSNRASAYSAQGQYNKAMGDYAKVAEFAPNNPAWQNGLAWLLATCPDTKLRDPYRAVELATEAVELDPKDKRYPSTLGVAHYRSGDCQAAITALKKSMDLRRGGDSFEWFFLAMAHWQLGEKVEARKWFDRAVQWMEKNDPQNEELRRFRAEAEQLMNSQPETRNREPEEK